MKRTNPCFCNCLLNVFAKVTVAWQIQSNPFTPLSLIGLGNRTSSDSPKIFANQTQSNIQCDANHSGSGGE